MILCFSEIALNNKQKITREYGEEKKGFPIQFLVGISSAHPNNFHFVEEKAEAKVEGSKSRSKT